MINGSRINGVNTINPAFGGRRAVPILYLDIDSTVRHGPDELGRFVNGPDDVVVFPEAIEMMRRWRNADGRIIGISNQGGIALGHTTQSMVNAAMRKTNELTGYQFDGLMWCPHHPDAPDPLLARCWCRKPSPGLLIEATVRLAELHHESYPLGIGLMVGDRPEDQECARLAGLDFQPAKEWRATAKAQEGA